MNLLSVREERDLVRLFFCESFWLAQEFLPREALVVDIGSGAGFPGLALHLYRPSLSVTLIEKRLKKAVFLKAVAAELNLDTVIVNARAEDWAGWKGVTIATARALRPQQAFLDRLAEHGVFFLYLRGAHPPPLPGRWQLLREARYPLARNRWASLYSPS